MVKYGDGAVVTAIFLPSDFSTVQIAGLPRDSTADSVRAQLRSYDLETSNLRDIVIFREEHSPSAVIRVKDPEFAKLHKTFKTVWLNFGTYEIANRVGEVFKGDTYKINDQVVKCAPPPPWDAMFRRQKVWTVRLTDVPAEATEADVINSIQSRRDRPRNIEIGEPSYSTDTATSCAKIQSLLTEIGALEWWEMTPDSAGKRMKAKARFQYEDDARTAAQKLNNTALPFHKAARLTVQLVYAAKFRVSALISEAIQSQLRANIKGWKAQHLRFVAYENSNPPKWYRVFKVESEVAKDVVEAKNTISNILAGVIAQVGSSTLWQPSRRSHGALSERLSQAGAQKNVVVLREKAKSQLRL
ncbi:Uu.00g083350.m01.CDS01 [Anthostomella pinea]|uniref:Uu.00g083350.m01.CDS01 n=1 Tax=Anthostomella pinea TaxID=933095 RepID=A0AAI8VLJ7_9PEZI|nr:Uu.00g083350.m01.CDS01 [Anthostomella pinea]